MFLFSEGGIVWERKKTAKYEVYVLIRIYIYYNRATSLGNGGYGQGWKGDTLIKKYNSGLSGHLK